MNRSNISQARRQVECSATRRVAEACRVHTLREEEAKNRQLAVSYGQEQWRLYPMKPPLFEVSTGLCTQAQNSPVSIPASEVHRAETEPIHLVWRAPMTQELPHPKNVSFTCRQAELIHQLFRGLKLFEQVLISQNGHSGCFEASQQLVQVPPLRPTRWSKSQVRVSATKTHSIFCLLHRNSPPHQSLLCGVSPPSPVLRGPLVGCSAQPSPGDLAGCQARLCDGTDGRRLRRRCQESSVCESPIRHL
mmetsp:Transcript_2414/g.7032  ORF Transcript_2414/g.7032 Transcript_2414/m.7032 type:complete len:248 (-) Transcript_2414:87-830(-)